MDINEWVVGRQEADRQRRSVLTLISQTDILLWGVDKSYQTYNREGGLKWDPPDFAHYLQSVASRGTGQTEESSQGSSERGHHQLVSVVQAVLQGREFAPIVEHQEKERHFRTIFVAERITSGAGPAKDDATKVVLALTIETTDVIVHSKLLLELEKLAANERAASEASALKSRFLANMSHEIRTPISGIIGLSELLRDGNINKEQSDLAFDIHESAQFLLTLVNDILDLSKIDSGQMSIETIPFNPCKMIRDTLVPLEFQARERELNLVWTYDVGTETTLLGDPHRMRQVLTNLISNSLKFTKKGTIRLDVTAVQKEGTDVLDMQFVVSDSGIGITKEALKQLFKPFSQADTSTARIYGGSGLGLSICQELIGLMGGRMTLDSTPGKGTTVTCNVPFNLHNGPSCDPPPEAQVPSRPHNDGASKPTTSRAAVQKPIQTKSPDIETKQAPKSNLLILLVDDNAINRKVNSYLLKKFGHEVVTASNGQEALDYLCKTSGNPRPNLVFMDCMMPVIDGYEATRRIRSDADMFDEQTRTMPIVALTASGQESDKTKCREAGMSDYISRPVSQSALKSAVLKWTSKKES
ncbi:hypothetical protein N0V94_005740 [Neodidymelliopsis sp. IMI 364377]|nr:hypothetical protein N0V94_005740 [Neodidymelliopsis sp. IMI 364377]